MVGEGLPVPDMAIRSQRSAIFDGCLMFILNIWQYYIYIGSRRAVWITSLSLIENLQLCTIFIVGMKEEKHSFWYLKYLEPVIYMYYINGFSLYSKIRKIFCRSWNCMILPFCCGYLLQGHFFDTMYTINFRDFYHSLNK